MNEHQFSELSRVAREWVKADKRSKMWRNIFYGAIVAYMLVMLGIAMIPNAFNRDKEEFVAVVDIAGEILPGTNNSSKKLYPVLKAAFEDEHSKGVILRMNSPGGAPAQADLINRQIRRLAEKNGKPVIAVIEDICASGCYYIAVSADKIYANRTSIIGSIGVRLDTFGFTGLMRKLGIENRSMYAGEHKAFINPFGPEDREGREYFREQVLERTHQVFIETVREGRKGKLKEDDPLLFTGMVWLADGARKRGLIDGIGDVYQIAEKEFGTENIRRFEVKRPWYEALMKTAANERLVEMLRPLFSLMTEQQSAPVSTTDMPSMQ
ncbi:S49 family peptidase [Sulfurivirga sp.]|uniref:S49 family peptidase n=1 Tax=Sulfurivirga sp. TaxID=2614236 RepID=UPI0025CBDCE5|nr:S49 family peptidase [Sulfurivirga sp.]